MASRGNVADFSTTETATESVAEESDQESLFSYPTPRSTTVSRTKRKRGRPPKTPSVIPQRARGKRGRPPLRKPHTTRCAPRSSASVDLQLTPTGRFTPETEPDSQLRDTTPFGNPPAAHPALRILLANPIESGGITYQTAGLDDAVPSDGLIRPVRPPHLTPFSTAPAAGPCPSAALPRTTRHAGAHSIDFFAATGGPRPSAPLPRTTGLHGAHPTPISTATGGPRPSAPLPRTTGLLGAHPTHFPTAPGGFFHSGPPQGVQSNNDLNEPAAHVNPQDNVDDAGDVGDGINDADLDDSHDEGPRQIFTHNRTLLLLQTYREHRHRFGQRGAHHYSIWRRVYINFTYTLNIFLICFQF